MNLNTIWNVWNDNIYFEWSRFVEENIYVNVTVDIQMYVRVI
jgi:hypothetical protein